MNNPGRIYRPLGAKVQFSTVCVDCSKAWINFTTRWESHMSYLKRNGWTNRGYEYSLCGKCEKKKFPNG